MSLKVVPVSRCLDKKLQILGYEVPDLLCIFLFLSILNFSFGGLGQKFLLVWLPSLILAIILRVGKIGKPDNYLIHLVRFHLRDKYLSAFTEPSRFEIPPKLKRGKKL